MRRTAWIRWITLGLVLPALCACATYQTKLSDFRGALRDNRPAEAAAKIKEKAFKDGDDQVVYLLEYGTAQQIARNFEESNKAFLRAEDLTEVKDYHSVARITGSLLLNEGMVQYKADDYEKVLINGMLAVNFLMLGRLEEAQVETRKLNDKLYKYRFEGKKNYQQNPFAFYLSALIWEANRNWDSAYIDFKKAFELGTNMPYLKEDLIRAAIAARREEDVAKWRKEFPGVVPADLRTNGEVVLVYQQGWGPSKRPHPNFPRIPKLYPNFARTVRARLEVDPGVKEVTQRVVDINDIAIKQLDEQYAGLIAMRAAGIATKAVVADQIRQKNQLLGDLAWLASNIADQADLRQWLSLPGSFQIAKVRLKPGKYRVRVVGLDSSDNPTDEFMDWTEIKVDAKRKSFLSWRSLK
jgi:uncharacterized protein